MAEGETAPRRSKGDVYTRVSRRALAIHRIAVLAKAAVDMPEGRASRRLKARAERMLEALKARHL